MHSPFVQVASLTPQVVCELVGLVTIAKSKFKHFRFYGHWIKYRLGYCFKEQTTRDEKSITWFPVGTPLKFDFEMDKYLGALD